MSQLAVQVLILGGCVITMAVLRWRDRDLLGRRRQETRHRPG